MTQPIRFAAGVALILVLASPSHAQIQRGTEVELGGAYERLTEGHRPWNEQHFRLQHRLTARSSVYGELLRSERFGLADGQVRIGAGTPLLPGWAVIVEGSFSPTSEVLPAHSITAELYRDLGRGWQVGVGGRSSEYEVGRVDLGTILVDYYLRDYRLGYRGTGAVLDGEWAPNHSASLSRYYGQGSAVTLLLAAGETVERTGPDSLLETGTTSVAAWGTHWLSSRLGLAYSFGFNRLESLFDRTRAEAGVRIRI